MKVSVDITGFDELISTINKMGKDVDQAKENALDAGAQLIKVRLQGNTPTSKLNKTHAKNNITIKKNGNSRDVGWGAKSKFYYMRYVNDGTSKQDAQNFVDKTLEESKSEVHEIAKQELWKVIDS